MNYLVDIVVSTIYLLFPFTVYYFYVAYNKKIEAKENSLIFGFVLFCSMYLTIRFGTFLYPRTALLISNIPILIAYSKNRTKEAIILSIMYIICSNELFEISFPYIIAEYIIYFLIYILKCKEKINLYVFTTIFFITKTILYIIRYDVANHFFDDSIYDDNLYVSLSILYLLSLIILYIVSIGDDIMRYHMNYRQLVREKQIRTSLFKITHEIKNPLAVCKGYLDMLDVNNKEQCQKYISIIKSEIAHTLLILQDFSSYTKISIDKDIMDINFLISEVVYDFQDIFKKNHIKVENSCDDEIYINADYTRLMQVLINIIKNSIEALYDAKKPIIRISQRQDRKHVYIFIEDNGIGIDNEDIKKITSPFFTTKKNGTGLGVSLSNEIILSHNGTLTYNSIKGKGTKVIIKLPKK